jgi:Ca2+-transporting ATPase
MVRNWHELDVKHVFLQLQTSCRGLTESEACLRLEKYGPNEITEKKKRSWVLLFLDQFRDFLVAILIFAAIFSAFIGEAMDSAFILVIVVVNAAFGFVQERRAEKTIAALKKLTNPEIIVVRDGAEQKVSSRDLVPGDIVVLEQGTKIPADLRLIEVASLSIDESAITGESVPVEKSLGTVSTANLAERKNLAYMGTIVAYGRGRGVVVDTGMHTEMGSIAHMIETVKEEATPLQKSLDVFGKSLGVLILGICVAIIAAGVLKGFGILDMVMTGIALAVAAVPEGLPAVVTITLALGIQRMSRQNAIIRKMHAVETLGSTTVICSDKTGTLTHNEMTIRKIWYAGREVEVTGDSYEPRGEFRQNGKAVDPDKELLFLLKASMLCNNSTIAKINGQWSATGDPTEVSFRVAALKAGINKNISEQFRRVDEIPFTSERKMMTTVNALPKDRLMVCAKGAPEILLHHCNRMMYGGRVLHMTPAHRKEILRKNHEFTQRSLRVLAIAYKEIPAKTRHGFESELVFLGLAGMLDPPRSGVRESIMLCKEAGIKVVMITGDHMNTAIAIAHELGIIEGSPELRVLTGDELEAMTKSQFEKIVEKISVYARVNPIHKVRIIDALKARGHVIAMTGDGVNDAPALKKADIGISMGITGTDVAKEASQMVLRDDNFSTIVTAIRDGRTIYDNIKKFVQYMLSSNLAEVLVIFLATLISFRDPATGQFILPLTAIQLLWINLLTDGLPAIALGVDPPEPNIMKRPPRDPKERMMSRQMLAEILVTGSVICAGVLFLFMISLPSGGTMAMTMAFTSMVIFELVRIQSIRMRYRMKFFSNQKLVGALLLSVMLQLLVVYAPPLQAVFRTAALGPVEWMEIALVSGIILFIMWFRTRVFTRNG